MNPLRLLYLLPAEGFGGAERQGIYHLAELPRHDVRVKAFVGPGDAIVTAMRDAGLQHGRFDGFPALSPEPQGLIGRARYALGWVRSLIRAANAIEDQIRGLTFDLMFANRTFAWLVAALLSRRLRIPYAIRAGSRPAYPPIARALPLLDHGAPPAAIFSNCLAVDRAIAAHLRCPAYMLPNAVDVGRFTPASPSEAMDARNRLSLPQDVPLVGLAARPAPGKGFDFFERVALEVHRRRPSVGFVVAGDFGWRAAYEARFSAVGLRPAIRFLGRVDAMPDFFHAVDVVLLTSRSRSIEASPNALLEAMAAGRAVVATSVGGVAELVHDGRDGYLVRDGDVAAFTNRLFDLLGDPARRAAFGAAGRTHVVLHHRTSAVVAEFVENLRQVASTGAVPKEKPGGASSCESNTRSVPRSTYSFAELRSKHSS